MKKRIGIICLIFVAVLGLTIAVLDITNIVDIHLLTDEAYTCTSLVFLKNRELEGIDRIVISQNRGGSVLYGKKSLVITDMDLVRQVVNETAIAKYTGIAIDEDIQIQLYDGNRLIRTMTGSLSYGTIFVYSPDSYHWIMRLGKKLDSDGVAILSDELRETLKALWLQEYGAYPN